MNRGNVGGSGSDHRLTHHLAPEFQRASPEDKRGKKSRAKPLALEKSVLPRQDKADQAGFIATTANISERAVSSGVSKKMLSGWLGSSWLGSLPLSPQQPQHNPLLQEQEPLAQQQAKSLSGRLSATSEKIPELVAMLRQARDIDSAQKGKLVELSQRLVKEYTVIKKGEGNHIPPSCLHQVAPIEPLSEWQELDLDRENNEECNRRHCKQIQNVSDFKDENAQLKARLCEREDDFRELQRQLSHAQGERKQLEQMLEGINNKLSDLLPKGERFDVADIESTVQLSTARTKHSSLGQELLLALGADKKPEDIPVDALAYNLTKLQAAKVEQDKLAESGIKDPAPYIAFWDKFIKTFDPTVKPYAIEPDHLLPNLQAVKSDSDRLHKIIDAFRRNGWTKGDEDLLSYLEDLPSQIKQSKSK